jgi:geranylgeranyl reductase family protein
MSVLLTDRAEFPRDKPCGGGVNMRTAHLLPFSLDPVIERTIHNLYVSVRMGKSYTRISDEPLTYMTQRRLLDAFLVEQAVKSGATLRERSPLRTVDIENGWVTVTSGGGRDRARALIGADGANGKTARMAGVPVKRTMGIALEGNVPVDDRTSEKWNKTFGVDVGDAPGGYGWLFPKGDHANVGVGGRWDVGPSLRGRLERLTRFYGFSPDDLWGVNGHPLPTYQRSSMIQRGPVAVVGDAAGFIDPLTGEGIFSAVKSGQIAARHVERFVSGAAPDLAGYQEEIERELTPDLLVSIQLHQIFHLAPPMAAELVKRSSRMWRLVCALLTGGIGYADIRTRHRWMPLVIDAASAAGRVKARHETAE